MKQLFNKLIPFVLILITILFVFFNFIKDDFPYTHDGENHLARFANYKIAIREGQFPPRWAPNLYNGYGYPVFNYNYPLANMISVPFSILKIHYETTFKIIVITSIILGANFVYLWFLNLNFSRKASFLSSLVFITNPYLLSAVYFRGNIGEIMALSIFPAVLYLYKKPSLFIFSYSLFLLSHNIAAFLGSIFLIIYLYNQLEISKENLIKYTKYFITSFMIVSFFWLPAYFEKNLIILDNAGNNIEYLKHFVTFKQLIISPLTFGFSYEGNIDTLSFSIGIISFLAFIISILIMIRKKDYKKINLFFAIVFVISILFQLKISESIWRNFEILQFTQFPWRFNIFTTIFGLYFIAYFYEYLNSFLKKLFFILIIINILYSSNLLPVDRFHREAVYYDSYAQSTSTLNENLPKNFTLLDIGNWLPTAKIIQGAGNVSIMTWNGSTREYKLDLTEESIIVEPTAYFEGWQTIANEKKVTYIDNTDVIKGRIAYKLNAGSYTIKSQFTQQTRMRIIGNFLSILGIISLIYFFYIDYNQLLKNKISKEK